MPPKLDALNRCKSSSLSRSGFKTDVSSSCDKSEAVKPTSKAHVTRCFKCQRLGHYADKCQNRKSMVTLQNVDAETEADQEDAGSIFDEEKDTILSKPVLSAEPSNFNTHCKDSRNNICLDLSVLKYVENDKRFDLEHGKEFCDQNPVLLNLILPSENVLNKKELSSDMDACVSGPYDLGLGRIVSMQDKLNEDQHCVHEANKPGTSSSPKPDQTQGKHCSDSDSFAYNPFPFNVPDLRTNLFEERGNDRNLVSDLVQHGSRMEHKHEVDNPLRQMEVGEHFSRKGLHKSGRYCSDSGKPTPIRKGMDRFRNTFLNRHLE